MAKSENSAVHTDVEEPIYYLQTGDAQAYGPVDRETLFDWCREGRIEPQHKISYDQSNWVSAAEWPELEMDWLLVLADNEEVGPFHRAVLDELLASGQVPDPVAMRNRRTDETIALSFAPPPTEEPPMDDDESGQPSSARLEVLAQHAAAAREQLAATRSELQQLRTAFTLLMDEKRHIEERLEAADTERNAAEAMLLEQQNLTAQSTTEVENLKARLDQMQEHYERLQLENQRQFEQIDDMRATAMAKEQSWKREWALLQAQRDAKARVLSELAEVLAQDDAVSPTHPRETTPASPQSPEDRLPVQEPSAPPAQVPTQDRQPPAPRISKNREPPSPYLHPQSTFPFRRLGLATLLILLLAGAGLLLRDGCQRRWNASAESTASPPAYEAPPPVHTRTDALTLQPEVSTHRHPSRRAADAANLRAWPDLNLPHTSISVAGKTMRIVFPYGLFESGTRLRENARLDLLALAAQLQGKLNGFTVIVEGHTDTTPVRADNTRFVDNFALGMARAEAVKHYLAEQGNLPPDKIQTASAGQSSPPFPNDTDENRSRNRTAIISIMQ